MQDVEEEVLDVVVHGLVVQEQLGEEAEVLAVQTVVAAHHLEHAAEGRGGREGRWGWPRLSAQYTNMWIDSFW